MARDLPEVGVVGLGTTGAGTVEVVARTGLSVTVVEVLAPAPLLEHLVTAGYPGRRSGRGSRDHAGR